MHRKFHFTKAVPVLFPKETERRRIRKREWRMKLEHPKFMWMTACSFWNFLNDEKLAFSMYKLPNSAKWSIKLYFGIDIAKPLNSPNAIFLIKLPTLNQINLIYIILERFIFVFVLIPKHSILFRFISFYILLSFFQTDSNCCKSIIINSRR